MANFSFFPLLNLSNIKTKGWHLLFHSTPCLSFPFHYEAFPSIIYKLPPIRPKALFIFILLLGFIMSYSLSVLGLVASWTNWIGTIEHFNYSSAWFAAPFNELLVHVYGRLLLPLYNRRWKRFDFYWDGLKIGLWTC